MSEYRLTWITDNLAVGHAPMCYADLDLLRQQGIRAIVNLCAEFCDLHEIERDHGFEVYYLPVHDNEVPSEASLEQALDWLDEAIYLGKKVLVHCRHGIGRTGTFVTAFLLRKGFGLKLAKKQLEKTRAGHASFSQWWLLRKYSKKAGKLTIREPSLEARRAVDLSPHFTDYEALLVNADELFRRFAADPAGPPSCGLETDRCCYELLEISFIEAAYLNHNMNRMLTSTERVQAIQRAVEAGKKARSIIGGGTRRGKSSSERQEAVRKLYRAARILCPLNIDSRCIIYQFRPVACRLYGLPGAGEATGSVEAEPIRRLEDALARISANTLHALSSFLPGDEVPAFLLADAVSGRFVQSYFEFLARSREFNEGS